MQGIALKQMQDLHGGGTILSCDLNKDNFNPCHTSFMPYGDLFLVSSGSDKDIHCHALMGIIY